MISEVSDGILLVVLLPLVCMCAGGNHREFPKGITRVRWVVRKDEDVREYVDNET